MIENQGKSLQPWMEVSQTGGDEQGDHDLKDYNRICWRARIFGRLSMTRAILGL